ncbi:MAG: hypothetical protein O7I93_03555 [Gemmatimonadetes bacterium]|nr:hypothetical protein [Gemmatimonadota bacterium]
MKTKITITLLFGAATGSVAQTSPCDPNIDSRGGSLGYQARGKYCEGLYATDVAATMMWVASLTGTFDDYDLSSTAPLKLSWRSPEGGALHVRAHGIKRNLYYRMDAPQDAGTGTWDWPTDLLAARGIERNDIGVLGWTPYSAGGVDYNLFVPVHVTDASPAAVGGGGSYELVVVPNVRLDKVYLSLAQVESVGQRPEGTFIKKQDPLSQRVYPTQRPIRIELTGFTDAGIYFVEVSATRADGRPVTMDPMWIYHAGASQ